MHERLRRAIQLLILLHEHDGLTVREITAALGCSRRTVFRDLEALRRGGYEIQRTESGYRLDELHEMPRASLDDDEVRALVTTLLASPLWKQATPGATARRALVKLLSACSPQTRRRWRPIASRLGLHRGEPGESGARATNDLSLAAPPDPSAAMKPVVTRRQVSGGT